MYFLDYSRMEKGKWSDELYPYQVNVSLGNGYLFDKKMDYLKYRKRIEEFVLFANYEFKKLYKHEAGCRSFLNALMNPKMMFWYDIQHISTLTRPENKITKTDKFIKEWQGKILHFYAIEDEAGQIWIGMKQNG